MSSTTPSATSPFSHLARNAPAAAAAAAASDDDDKKKKEDEEKAAKKKAEEEEDKKKKEEEEKAAKKKAEDEDKKKKDEEAKKKGKADDGDDETDREDDEDPEARAARARERGRIRAIVESEAASFNMKAATRFALRTKMSREEVIAHLEAMEPSAAVAPVRAVDSLRERMAREPSPDIGPNDATAPATGTQATAAAIIAAGKKRRGEAA